VAIRKNLIIGFDTLETNKRNVPNLFLILNRIDLLNEELMFFLRLFECYCNIDKQSIVLL